MTAIPTAEAACARLICQHERPLSRSCASDLLALERLVIDAQALLADALTLSGRLTGQLPPETVLRVRLGLAVAGQAVSVATAPLAGATAEAQDTLKGDEPPW